MNIFGFGERAHHDYVLVFDIVHLFDSIGVKIDLTNGSTGGGIYAVSIVASGFFGCFDIFQCKLRVQHLVNLFGGDAVQSGRFVDQSFFDHIVRDLDSSLGGTFAIASLQHPEFAMFDGELDILHIFVMILESFGDIKELGINFR